MKTVLKITVAIIMMFSLLTAAPVKAKAQLGISISIQTFYRELSPYGQWIDDPQYGYIWAPDVQPGFRPYYTGGHWLMTSFGFTWVSDYSWGWAPFHYGRWVYTDYYGWVWIPDTTWGPAWVVWRWGGDYCGWAPLGPGISVSLSFGNYSIPNDWWVFIPQRYCLNTSFYNYRIAPQRNVAYIRNTTVVNNTYVRNNVTYVAGPRIGDVQKATGRKLSVYNVANASRPGRISVQGNAVKMYRPQITGAKANAKVTPPSVVSKDQFMKNRTRAGTGAFRNAERTPVPGNGGRAQAQQNKVTRNNRATSPPQRPQQRNISRASGQRQQISQSPQQMQRRQIPQQNNGRAVMPQHHQQTSAPPPMEQRQIPRQDNRNVAPQQRQQISQPSPQRQQPQGKPGNRGRGKGNS